MAIKQSMHVNGVIVIMPATVTITLCNTQHELLSVTVTPVEAKVIAN